MQAITLGLLKRLGAVAATTTLIGLSTGSAFAASAISTNLTTGNGTTTQYQSSTTANPGDIVNFKVFLQNTGDATGTNPMISDTLDSRLSYVAGSSVEYTKQGNNDVQESIPDSYIKTNGQTLTWGFGSIPNNPQSSIYLTFQAKVAAASQFSVGQTNLTDQATSSFDGVSAQTNTVNIAVTDSATPVQTFADRTEVTDKTKGDARWYGNGQVGSISAGDTVTYRVIVANTGNTDATNVAVKDVLPAGVAYAGNPMIYDDANPTGTAIDASTLFTSGYVISNLPAGNSHAATITFDATVTGACSNADLTDGSSIIFSGAQVASDSTSVLFACSNGLVITKQVENASGQFVNSLGETAQNSTLTYQIEVLNNSTSTVTNPTVNDVLPAYLTYVPGTLTIDGEAQDQASQQYFFGSQGLILTNLTPGLGKQIQFKAKLAACAVNDIDVKNTATVSAQGVAAESASADVTLTECVVSPTPTPNTPSTPAPSATPVAGTTLPTTGPEEALAIPGILSGLGVLAARKRSAFASAKHALRKIDIR
jgi:uncharacterized repeat protein (TIGR01451 family)/fimbrial isopeptide formation D2 family protein